MSVYPLYMLCRWALRVEVYHRYITKSRSLKNPLSKNLHMGVLRFGKASVVGASMELPFAKCDELLPKDVMNTSMWQLIIAAMQGNFT